MPYSSLVITGGQKHTHTHTDDFDTADIVDGDDVNKNSVDELEDTVKGVEHNAGDSTTNELTCGDTFFFFPVILR